MKKSAPQHECYKHIRTQRYRNMETTAIEFLYCSVCGRQFELLDDIVLQPLPTQTTRYAIAANKFLQRLEK